VEEAMAVFHVTHVVRTNGMGRAWWERIALPASGGAAEQPAKVLQQLEWIRQVADDELREEIAHAARERRQDAEARAKKQAETRERSHG
jgi:hypothetical protein